MPTHVCRKSPPRLVNTVWAAEEESGVPVWYQEKAGGEERCGGHDALLARTFMGCL